MQDYIRDENHEQNKTTYCKSMEKLNTYVEKEDKMCYNMQMIGTKEDYIQGW